MKLEGRYVVADATLERCGNCDKEWRRRGRATRAREPKKPKKERAADYRPRMKFRDWE